MKLLCLFAFSCYAFLAIISHLAKPELNPIHQPLSEYALGPSGSWMGLAIQIRGIGGLLFAILLAKLLPTTPRTRWLVVFIGLWGVCCLLSGLFPTDLVGDPPTIAGRIHRISAPSSWFLVCLAVIQLTFVIRGEERAAIDNTFVRVMAAATLATFLIVLAVTFANGGRGPYLGLAQRAFHVAFMAWIFGIIAVDSSRSA